MPLINHSPAFLEKQKRRKIALKAIEDAKNRERFIQLIDKETELRLQLANLDSEYLPDHDKLHELQVKALTDGIPLIQFFSHKQYELILKMIRVVRLYNNIAKQMFDGFNLDIFAETEDIVAMCKSNIEHLKFLEEFGEIKYSQKYLQLPAKRRKSHKSSVDEIQEAVGVNEFESNVNDFMFSFNNSRKGEDE